MSDGQLILVAGALLAGGLLASLFATRVRVPALVLFLGLGMAVGSDGTGWIDFADYELARTLGIVALSLILFEGGMDAGLKVIRPVLRPALLLAVVGTVVTAVVCGLAAASLFDFSTREGLLVGSTLAVTDAAAIFAMLRGSKLPQRLIATLEGESGFNDPVAILLVIGFIDWIQKPDYGLADMILAFFGELGIGAVCGLAIGWLACAALKRVTFAGDGVYPVATLSALALAYGLADVAHGSGFLAVYLTGLMIGSLEIPALRTVRAFHDGLGWIAQIGLFFTLGLLVFPSQLDSVAVEATILAAVAMFVARPAAVFVSTAFEHFSVRDKVVLSWAGLRGAVPVVLATFAVIDGVPRSIEFFNIVFFAVVLSTLLQGMTFEPLSRRLGTSRPKT